MSVILITGASSGIGKASAKHLLGDGHTVYVAARHTDAMQDLSALGALSLRLDVTGEDELVAAVEQIEARHGGLDVLINNAGFGLYGSVEETTMEDARYQFEVNLFGMARLTQLVIPLMREKRRGRIINTASMGGRIYTPLGAWYHATKHAVEGWSDALRLELAPFGIEVVLVEPGIIGTEFGNVSTGPMLERSGNSPYGKLAQAIARARAPMSPLEVVAQAMSRAVAARRAKTRYVAGSLARSLMFVREHLGDRVYDFPMMTRSGFRPFPEHPGGRWVFLQFPGWALWVILAPLEKIP